jgi:outer membrane receptor for ferrienterochelin and colicin
MLKSKLATAVVAALAFGCANAYAGGIGSSGAQDVPSQDTASQADQSSNPGAEKAKRLQTITVTGSLIPQTEIETATPVTTITTEDMKVKGFSTVAEALQGVSFATGSVQGSQYSGGFTQGAETVSLFGLNPGYTKYLINGKPMGSFPALYNGSDAFNNIAGIPADLVDHIDILPGGQSSLYGSDAIAGVINVVLKEHVDAPTLSARYGWDTGGGGASRRLSGADSWQFGRFNLLAGFQYDSKDPIWGTDRGLTAHRNNHGLTAAYPSYDVIEYSALSSAILPYMMDPNKCSNLTGLFGGTEHLATRGGGQYCGSEYSGGWRTLTNRVRSGNAYAHATFDISSDNQLYGDVLYGYSDTRFSAGSNYTWWGTSLNYGAIWDPNVNGGNGDLVEIQKSFAPEEVGGYASNMSKQYDTSLYFTLGDNGTFGSSGWDYDVGLTHSEEHTTVANFVRFNDAVENYFADILGPQLDVDPLYHYYPVFSPNYGKLYSPVSPSDFNSFTGYVNTRAKTWNNMLRAQLTSASLFSLPGGDAGLAIVAEGGNEGWDYTPAPQLLDGTVWGQTDVQGSGHRSRYALTAELRMPIFSMLTLDMSGRRDSYHVNGDNVGKTTYMVGVEFRPFEGLLVRGRYGTAFKAPTLADEFQGLSGFYTNVTDYYSCSQLGFDPAHAGDCAPRYSNHQVYGEQSGNTELKPINAKVWSYGVVWAPNSNFNVSVDYFHTDIDNEVNQQSIDGLLLTEYQCRTGILDINSPNCVQALSQVERSPQGDVSYIFVPKVNVSNETTNNVIAHFSYLASLGSAGNLTLQGSYSNTLKHTYQQYPGDPKIDLLRHPGWSTDFKTKENLTVSWSRGDWGASLYINRFGHTPNYISTTYDDYVSSPYAAKLKPWTLYNASLRYQVTPALGLSFMVNNLFNKMPPIDYSYGGNSSAPYNEFNYNVYGRAMYLQASYQFGK